jgi:hypothetical protein
MKLLNADGLIDWLSREVPNNYIAEFLDKDSLLENLEAKDAAEYFGLELVDHLDRDKLLGYLGVQEPA